MIVGVLHFAGIWHVDISEGMALLEEGQHPVIESAGIKAGMAIGPLAVSDEVNLALVWHIREQTRKDLA